MKKFFEVITSFVKAHVAASVVTAVAIVVLSVGTPLAIMVMQKNPLPPTTEHNRDTVSVEHQTNSETTVSDAQGVVDDKKPEDVSSSQPSKPSDTSSNDKKPETDSKPEADKNPETDKKPTTSTGILDSGKCGDNLYWELNDAGTLRIFGSGPMYDYFKYYEPSPWYKYRSEPILSDDGKNYINPDGTAYDSVLRYNESNPKGYKIKNIVIEKGVTYIGNWAFYRVCVDTLTIPEGVKTIGAWAIRFSPSLRTVNLPNSLTTLGDFSLSKNKVLKTVKFGNKLKTIGNGVFSSSSVEELILPDSVTSIGEDLNKDYDGINEKNIGVFDNCTSLKKVSLGSVDKIPQRAFISCKKLNSVVIPNTVESIGTYAFAYCSSLKTVTFEKNSICSLFSNYAFYNCSELTSIIGATALKTVKDVALTGCNNLQHFEFSDANTAFYTYCFSSKPLTGTARIGDGLVTVQAGLLTKTKIDTLYISNKVQKIQSQAIANCELLKNIYYEGTRQQWDAIAKTSDWAKGVSASCTVHFSDGTTALLSKVD